jgi:hypothetical protein
MRFFTDTKEFIFDDPSQYPTSKPLQKRQITDRTADGDLQVENFNINVKTRTLNFVDMSKHDYDGLLEWFDNVADGAANTFSFEDEWGDISTMRIISNVYDFPETSYQRYSGSLILEHVQ